jgi:hypothetical protein
MRWWNVRVSGPVDVEVPDLFMASATSAVEKWGELWSRGWALLISLISFLDRLSCARSVMVVNCRQKESAMSLWDVI